MAASSNVKTPQLENSNAATLSQEYVTGICEGLASFTYSRNGNGINLRFSLRLQENDRSLLFSLMRFFGVGNVYHSSPGAGASSDRGGCWYYCVSKVSDIERIIRHFELHPLMGSKARSFDVWRQMFDLKRTPRKADTAALFELAAKLSTLSRRRPATRSRAGQ
ncbi:MAG: LAGLIDADG family homing endonuclease [Elusimicrobia bacterium]|nr:LAGLIDADG family homing endonuclease [Elusimicrobiota bacterium]